MKLYERINQELCTYYISDNSIDYSGLGRNYRLYESLMDEIISGGHIRCCDVSLFGSTISACQNLSEDFIERNIDILDFSTIVSCQKLSDAFLERHIDKIDLNYLPCKQPLSESFIEKYLDKLSINYVCECQKLSEDFIERHIDLLFPFITDICIVNNLSEDFYERHKDLLRRFDVISKYKKLSEDFIRRNINSLKLSHLIKYQRLSDSFISDFGIDRSLLSRTWMYKSSSSKKRLLVESGKYDCQDDYFIAYKAIRRDRYSLYNFQYRYEKGGIYESWCDCTKDENSFGLSVGTYGQAKLYGGTACIIVRCKVRYEDVGRVVHDGKKVRCFKIEVLD